MQERQVRSKNELRLLRSADADRKPIGERLAANSLRLQIARWVNEGGAGEDDLAPIRPGPA